MSSGSILADLVNILLPKPWRLIRDVPDVQPVAAPPEPVTPPPAPEAAEGPVDTAVIEALPCRAEPQRYFTLGEDLGLTRLLDGHFLYVDPMDEAVAAHLIARGYWEAWIHQVVCDLVQPGDHIVEVGANFGVYTVAMARKAGADGSVLTFEANPGLAELVGRSVRFNGYSGSVTVVGKAASDKAGIISFATSRRNAGGGAISTSTTALGADSVLVQVEAVTLDSMASDKTRIIRMDAEGSEPLILRGAARLLQRPDIVVCMEWDVIQMRNRADVGVLVDWLVELGFRFWRIQYDSTLLQVPAAEMPTLSACDVVMARNAPDGVTVVAPLNIPVPGTGVPT